MAEQMVLKCRDPGKLDHVVWFAQASIVKAKCKLYEGLTRYMVRRLILCHQ